MHINAVGFEFRFEAFARTAYSLPHHTDTSVSCTEAGSCNLVFEIADRVPTNWLIIAQVRGKRMHPNAVGFELRIEAFARTAYSLPQHTDASVPCTEAGSCNLVFEIAVRVPTNWLIIAQVRGERLHARCIGVGLWFGTSAR